LSDIRTGTKLQPGSKKGYGETKSKMELKLGTGLWTLSLNGHEDAIDNKIRRLYLPTHLRSSQSGGKPRNRDSVPDRRKGFLSSVQHSDRLWGPPSLHTNEYRAFFRWE
jgi:hypothetical protein